MRSAISRAPKQQMVTRHDLADDAQRSCFLGAPRPHNCKNVKRHHATPLEFAASLDQKRLLLNWFRALPLLQHMGNAGICFCDSP